MDDYIMDDAIDMFLDSLSQDGDGQSGTEYLMSGALNAEIPHAAQSSSPVATGSGTNAPTSHPAPPPQQPRAVTTLTAPAPTPRRVRFQPPPPPAATTAPRPVVVDHGMPAVPVEPQTADPFAFSPDGTAQLLVDPLSADPFAPGPLLPSAPLPISWNGGVRDDGSEEDLYGASDIMDDGSDRGVSWNNGPQSTGRQNSGTQNNGNTREEPRPASPTRLKRRREHLSQPCGPPAKARRWDLAEMAERRDADTMLRFILRAVGDDMASHIAYRSVLAAWWQLSAYPTHAATLRRGEVWMTMSGRTGSIIRDTLDDLYKRRRAMRQIVLADPLDTKYWVDLNTWFRLEGPYRLTADVDDFEDSLSESRRREFNAEYIEAKDVASGYIHATRLYYDEVEEMDWTPGGDESEPEPEEDDEEDNNGLSELNIVEPRKPENLYETAFAAGFGPEMRRSLIGLDLADLMRWKPMDQEKGFWKK